MRRPRVLMLWLLAGLLLLPAGSSARAAPPSPQHALINQYCVTCHNEKAKTAGLMLDKLDIDHAAEHAEVWEKVVRKLRGGMMPPQGMPRPEQAKIDGLITWLQTSLDQAAAAHPEPGRAPLHRLNRTEYANAIRDLLGLKVDVTALLPADDESNGFDNIAEVLRVSPSLLEAYLAASREVSSLAVGDPKIGPISQSIQVPPDLAQDEHIEGLPLGTRGGILIHHNFPLDADYEFNVILLRNIVGYLTGMEFPHQLEVSIDGERVFLAPVGGEEDLKLVDTNLALAGDTLDARLEDQGACEGRSARCGGGIPAARFGGIGRAAAALHARFGSAEHERHPADRSRADHRTVRTPPGRATRPAGDGFSFVLRRIRRTKFRARRRFWARWRGGRIGAR